MLVHCVCMYFQVVMAGPCICLLCQVPDHMHLPLCFHRACVAFIYLVSPSLIVMLFLECHLIVKYTTLH